VYRQVSPLDVKEILRLWASGVPKKRIATVLRLDVKTVRRYLAAAIARGALLAHGTAALDSGLAEAVVVARRSGAGRKRGEDWLVCEQHRSFIARHVEAGLSLSTIDKLLRDADVPVNYYTLRRFAIEQLERPIRRYRRAQKRRDR
jgi:hypothetical protein